MNNPSLKSLSVYAYVIAYQRKTGNCPTYQQIADHFDWKSANAVSGHIAALRKHGYIAPIDKNHRRISLPEQRKPAMSAEIRGRIEDANRERIAALDELARMAQEVGEYD